MIGSLADIVAVALDFAPFFSDSCEESVDVIVPRVTVKDSAVSDSASSVAVMVMVLRRACGAVRGEGHRAGGGRQVCALGCIRAARGARPRNGARSAFTVCDSVTVKVASLPSATLAEGPEMLSSAVSLSPGVPSWST